PADPPEDAARHQPGPTRIVVIEEPAHELAGREESGDRPLLAVDDLALARDLEPAERERDARRHRVAHVRRRVERQRPVRLGWRDPVRRLAVLDGRIVVAGPE